jgi:hypothetical protein
VLLQNDVGLICFGVGTGTHPLLGFRILLVFFDWLLRWRQVVRLRDGKAVDAACRDRTASWVRSEAESDASVTLCQYFEVSRALLFGLVWA